VLVTSLGNGSNKDCRNTGNSTQFYDMPSHKNRINRRKIDTSGEKQRTWATLPSVTAWLQQTQWYKFECCSLYYNGVSTDSTSKADHSCALQTLGFVPQSVTGFKMNITFHYKAYLSAAGCREIEVSWNR